MDDKNPLKMKVTELKVELGRRGLSQTGLKFDLAQRLQTAMDVDEFGALPSLASSSQPSSSPLLSVPGRDSTEHAASSPQSMEPSSYGSTKGQATDKQPNDLEMGAETEGTEEQGINPSDQPNPVGSPSTVLAATQSENIVPLIAEDTPTLEETLSSRKRERDENGVKGDGSDQNTEFGILGAGRELETCGGGDAEREQGDTGVANEKKADKEEDGVTVTEGESALLLTVDSSKSEEKMETEECITFGESAVPPSSDSSDEKDNATAEGGSVTVGAEDTPLLPLDSTGPTCTPTSPQQGTEYMAGERKDQTGVGVEDLDETTTGRRDGLIPDGLKDCGRVTMGAKDGFPFSDEIEGGANQRNDANQDGSSELPPDSLLLCSQTDRMKDREQRFRQEQKPAKKDNTEEGNIEDNTRSDGANCEEASCDAYGHGGKVDSSYSGSVNVEGKGSSSSGGDASSEAPGAGTAEDARKTKLMKRKERFMAPSPTRNAPPAKSKNVPFEKLETPSADCSASKVPAETVLEETSETASSRRQMASEAAAKMARRAERFGVKRGGSSVPSETSPVKVRDPRGSFFAESDGTSEGKTKKQPPTPDGTTSGEYSFDPLPQRQKRVRATTPMSWKNDGAPAKRRGVGGDQADTAGAESGRGRAMLENTVGKAPPSGAVATPDTNCKEKQQTDEVAKPKERNAHSRPADRDGVDESRVRSAAGNPLPPSSGKTMSLASTFVLLGVKPAPKLSPTATTAVGEGASKDSRGGCLDEGKQASKQSHGRDEQKRASPAHASHGRGGGKRASSPPHGSHHACRDNAAEKKATEQAAKMAERRQRFAEDPRAPSFR